MDDVAVWPADGGILIITWITDLAKLDAINQHKFPVVKTIYLGEAVRPVSELSAV